MPILYMSSRPMTWKLLRFNYKLYRDEILFKPSSPQVVARTELQITVP